MSWPTPQEYNEAIQNPRQNLSDPELAAGSPDLTPLGLPRPITGNFATVYRLHCGKRDWAVRCFWREVPDIQARYVAISRHLGRLKLPFTVGFDYQTRGIRVAGSWYPILKMEWVEGELLDVHIRRNLQKPEQLARLADRWLQMARALDDAEVAHGDLQHANVLVSGSDLKLVDYDGMFVPELFGRRSHELGHPNYQHPKRNASDFFAALDRFSITVVYVALRALSFESELWDRLKAGDECLLLRKPDFVAPNSSVAFSSLEELPDEVRDAVLQLREMLRMTPRRLAPLPQASPRPRPDWLPLPTAETGSNPLAGALHRLKRNFKLRLIQTLYERRLARCVRQAESLEDRARRERLEVRSSCAATREVIQRRRERLAALEREDSEGLLERIRRRHVRRFLGRSSLLTADLPEVGVIRKLRLLLFGIYSAADVSQEKIVAIRPLGAEVVRAVVGWRVDLELVARRGMPETLSEGQRKRISIRYEPAHAHLQRKSRRLEKKESLLLHVIDARRQGRLEQVERRRQALLGRRERVIAGCSARPASFRDRQFGPK